MNARLKKTIDKVNEKLFDHQIKKAFPVDKKAPKICMYCNKDLNCKDSKYGIEVCSDGATSYYCKECDDELREIRENYLDENCPYRVWHHEDAPLEVCCNCTNHCHKELRKIEEDFIKTKKGKLINCEKDSDAI